MALADQVRWHRSACSAYRGDATDYPRQALAAALVAVCILAGWGTGQPASATGMLSPLASVSNACGFTPTPGTATLTLAIGGHQRVVLVHVPPGDTGKQPWPVVLNLHGSQSTAAQQEAFSGMDATADADSFIAAYPQAALPAGSGFDWNVPGVPLLGGAAVPAGAPDDVAFLRQVVDALRRRYCVDRTMVYVTGFSGGARMASQLACDAADTFAAVAPVSGLRFPASCNAARPVPVISFHGTADPVDPYQGNGQVYWTYSVPVAAQRWAAHNGCAPTPTTSQRHQGVTLAAYTGCREGGSVELYTLDGEGHEWPGGPHMPRAITREFGPQSTAIAANSVMWRFFAAHPLVGAG